MVLARTLEDKIASLYHAGRIVGGVYLGRGQEAFSVALTMALRPGTDVYAPLIRDQAGRTAFGEPILDVLRTYLGSALGPMRGRDGNIHRGRPSQGVPAMISHLGSMISYVCGMLVARRFKGTTGHVGATSVGDGATSTGSFHEAMNLAGVERLPLVVTVANNQFAYSTPTERQFACKDLAIRAAGYGFEAHTVDGTDLEACLEVMGNAVEKARTGHGPQMVVGTLLRLCGHGEHDDASYVPPTVKAGGIDCLKVARQKLLDRGWATPQELEVMEAEAYEMVQAAVVQAQKEPAPDPGAERWQPLASQWLIEGQSEQ
ncbi:MAG: thiamine pyrophosphate-dependent dehydrogenase E1 component subunit alpha [Verrucomicrobiales bacterium]|nr:thiamine pyrophosphate-dependent dehydrogenase E1 component subunit alpha [Verrucomicrobiales bacterium]